MKLQHHPLKKQKEKKKCSGSECQQTHHFNVWVFSKKAVAGHGLQRNRWQSHRGLLSLSRADVLPPQRTVQLLPSSQSSSYSLVVAHHLVFHSAQTLPSPPRCGDASFWISSYPSISPLSLSCAFSSYAWRISTRTTRNSNESLKKPTQS